jgi:hypothetical protein
MTSGRITDFEAEPGPVPWKSFLSGLKIFFSAIKFKLWDAANVGFVTTPVAEEFSVLASDFFAAALSSVRLRGWVSAS